MRDHFLKRVNTFITRHPGLLIASATVLMVLSALSALTTLRIRNSRYDLIAPDEPTGQRWNGFSDDFGVPESLVVAAQGSSRAETETYMASLADLLAARADLVEHLSYRKPIEFFRAHGLLFVPESQLREIARAMRDNGALLQNLSRDPTFTRFFTEAARASNAQWVQAIQRVLSGEAGTLASQIHLVRVLTDGVAASIEGESPEPPWSDMAPGVAAMEQAAGSLDPYFATWDGAMLFMFVQARRDEMKNADGAPFVEEVRRTARALRDREFPALRVGLTGAPALAADEGRQTTRDMALASVVAFVGVGLICIAGFRELVRPLFGLFVLAVSIAATFGLTAVTIGYLNMITVTITVTLVGLGIDFGIHVLDRFEEELRNGQNTEGSIESVVRRTSPAVLTGAVTTALAFYAVMLSDFRGFAQLGFIGGSGILLCCIVTLLVLPAMLYLSGKRRGGAAKPRRGGRFKAVVAYFLARPARSVAAFGLVTLALVPFAPQTRRFDFSLLSLQAKDTESVRYEREMSARSDFSPRYAVGFAGDLQALAERVARIRALPTVASVESPLSFIPDDQPAKLRLAAQIRALIPVGLAPIPDTADVAELREAVIRFRDGLAAQGGGPQALRLVGQTALADELQALLASLDRLAGLLDGDNDPAVAARIGSYQRHSFEALWRQLKLLKEAAPDRPLSLDSLPGDLKRRFVGRSGSLAYYVSPDGSIWDRAFLRRFVGELQSVDPEITGPPVVLLEMSSLMLRGYKRAALYATLVILLIVFLDFRSLTSSLLAMLPLAVSAVWLVGLMGLFGIRFNLANLVALPLILGIGITSGIHMVHRYRQEGCRFGTASGTGHAVFLSLLTTVCGFGSLCIARHTGLHSLGLVLTIGVAGCLVNAVVLLPILMDYLIRHEHTRRHPGRREG